jgi:hypothetical protein
MNLVDRKIVLSLNGNWQPIGLSTVKQAFIGMNGGDEENPPTKALNIEYPQDENGNYNFSNYENISPLTWLEWLALPIREFDYVINTSKYKIRVPSVIVAINFKKLPKKKFRPTASLLYEMQKGICGYTGEHITFRQGNIEHVKPRSMGGRDTFGNLIYVKKEVNSLRGNKPLSEVGLKPLFHHKEPAPMPVNYTIKNILHNDWKFFVDIERV